MDKTLPHLKIFTEKDEAIELNACGSWPETRHLICKDSAYALEMALKTGRPLLVKGEPGIGKSNLARAAANALGRGFISEVININTEGQDLLWRMDLVSRLNDAQIGKEDSLPMENYISPGILWWAINWEDANGYQSNNTCCNRLNAEVQDTENRTRFNNGMVVLIDEIDKADPSLPNSLLEALGNGGFTVPQTGKTIRPAHSGTPPLVIITTNNERELPPAFLRRCLVLNLSVDEDGITEWLKQRARVHYTPEQCSDKVLEKAAEQIKGDRNRSASIKPGLAEYLDLLCAMDEMIDVTEPDQRENDQLDLLKNIQDLVLRKAE